MKLDITAKGILTLTGTPIKNNEFLIRNGIEVIDIVRKENDYWESEGPVKDGYYIYVNTNQKSIKGEIDTVLDPDPDADYSETELFTITNLRNCLLNYEKKIISSALCDCAAGSGTVCRSSSADRQMADFLLATVFVIENLICKGKYQDAAEIIDKVHSCNGFCQNEIINTPKCNCC